MMINNKIYSNDHVAGTQFSEGFPLTVDGAEYYLSMVVRALGLTRADTLSSASGDKINLALSLSRALNYTQLTLPVVNELEFYRRMEGGLLTQS